MSNAETSGSEVELCCFLEVSVFMRGGGCLLFVSLLVFQRDCMLSCFSVLLILGRTRSTKVFLPHKLTVSHSANSSASYRHQSHRGS